MTVLSYNNHKYNGPSPFLNYKINNWLQFFFLVKAAALKQQMSTFYPQKQINAHKLDITFFHSAACHKCNKNSSEDEIANVNFLRRYGTYVLQNTKKENLLRLTN